METKYYSAERNVQILVSLLKQHGIKKIIASPGTTNMPFVASVQYDKWFDVISCCLLYTSPSPRDGATSRMPSSA